MSELIREIKWGNIIGSKINPDGWKIYATDFEFIMENTDDYFPIPLSPEWLERFTFQSEINLLRNHKLFIIDNYISLCHENKTFSVAIHSTLGAYPLAIKLSFVHQLQNLYFALTGSELILKQ